MFSEVPARAPKSAGTVLVVDDLEPNVQLLTRILLAQGYSVVTAQNGHDALDVIRRESPDVVLSDVRMPRLDGFGLCRVLKGAANTRLTPVVLMTGASESEDRIRAIEAGANDFITKPIDQPELKARIRSLMQLKHFTDDLDSAEAVLRSLALMVEARDSHTEGHCERLARYAIELGQLLQLPEEDLMALGRGGYFHDIGKIALPDAILLKRGPLSPEEYAQVKEHPVIGDRLCGDLRALHGVRPIVRHHHERFDGSGYPDGLAGDAIPLLAHIVGICDVYDALTSHRPYHLAMPAEEAFAELREEAGRGWYRPDLVEAFITSRRQQMASVAGPVPVEL
jgi:putative two-component system response regulator